MQMLKTLQKPSVQFFILMAATFCVSVSLLWMTLPCPDLTWLTLGTAKMLQGEILYRDIIEPNPPLVFWLYSLPVYIGLQGEWSLVLVLRLCTVFLIMGVLFLCNKILNISTVWVGREKYSFLLGIAGVLLLSADHHMIFSQREHLLVVLVLPYVLWNLPSLSGRKSRAVAIPVGVLAALGLCLKPHYFIIPIFIVIDRMLRKRRWKACIELPELIIGMIAILYMTAIIVWTPQYFDWLKILMQVYGAHGYVNRDEVDVLVWFIGYALLGLIMGAVFKLHKVMSEQSDIAYLAWLSVGAFLEAFLQFKTWDYILYPFMAFGLLTLMGVFILKRLKDFLSFACVAWFFYSYTPWTDWRQELYINDYKELMEVLEPYKTAEEIYITGLFFAPPQFYSIYTPLKWSGKFNTFFFMLAGTLEESPDTYQPTLTLKPGMEEVEQWILDNVAEDLEKKKPELLVTWQIRSQYVPEEDYLDFVTWFKKDPHLSRILDGYRFIKSVELCKDPENLARARRCTYKIYQRKS